MKFNRQSAFGSLAIKPLYILLLSVMLSACDWGDQIESLVQPNPDDFAVLFSDTSMVQLSTVVTDSVMTGGSGRLLVGRYVDPYFGKIQANSFFQPNISTGVVIPEGAEYDSLVVSLEYDNHQVSRIFDNAVPTVRTIKYSHGDTTKAINITVHKVLADIMDRGSYYNESQLAFEPAPVGNVKLTAMPNIRTRLTIRLSDVLGKEIFDKGKKNLITSSVDWLNIVKGITLRASANDNAAILGFSTSNARLQLHYHLPSIDGIVRDSTNFTNNTSFNQILSDRKGTPIANLPTSQRISLPTSQTGNLAFVQGGTGIMTRIDLPSIKEFKVVKYTAANRAFLRITPLRQTLSDQFRAPSTLYAYRVDKNNEYYRNASGFPLPLYTLSLREPLVVSATFHYDLITNRQFYLLDVSSLVTEIIASDNGEAGALLLRTSASNESPQGGSPTFPFADTESTKSFDRLVIGSQQHSEPGVKLELYYTTVKAQ